MKVLIIEGRKERQRKNLKYLLGEVDSAIVVEGIIDTVSGAITYFKEDPSVELVFMDIHLADGISFEIFEQVKHKATGNIYYSI